MTTTASNFSLDTSLSTGVENLLKYSTDSSNETSTTEPTFVDCLTKLKSFHRNSSLPHEDFTNQVYFFANGIFAVAITVVGVVVNSVNMAVLGKLLQQSKLNATYYLLWWLGACDFGVNFLYLIFAASMNLRNPPIMLVSDLPADTSDFLLFYYHTWFIAANVCLFVSNWITVCVTVVRLVAIYQPLQSARVLKMSRVRGVVAILIIVSIASVVPDALVYQMYYEKRRRPTHKVNGSESNLDLDLGHVDSALWNSDGMGLSSDSLTTTMDYHAGGYQENTSYYGYVNHSDGYSDSGYQDITSDDYRLCIAYTDLYSDASYRAAYTAFRLTVFQLLPYGLTAVSVSMLVKAMWCPRKGIRLALAQLDHIKNRRKSQRRVSITMVTVAVWFLVTTLPSLIYFGMRDLAYLSDRIGFENNPGFIAARGIADILLLLNHAGNFFIYCLGYPTYRRRFINGLLCRSPRKLSRAATLNSMLGSIRRQNSRLDAERDNFSTQRRRQVVVRRTLGSARGPASQNVGSARGPTSRAVSSMISSYSQDVMSRESIGSQLCTTGEDFPLLKLELGGEPMDSNNHNSQPECESPPYFHDSSQIPLVLIPNGTRDSIPNVALSHDKQGTHSGTPDDRLPLLGDTLPSHGPAGEGNSPVSMFQSGEDSSQVSMFQSRSTPTGNRSHATDTVPLLEVFDCPGELFPKDSNPTNIGLANSDKYEEQLQRPTSFSDESIDDETFIDAVDIL